MRRMTWIAVGVLASAALAAEPQKKESEGVIDPKADAQLKRMSEYLTGLKSFRVDTTAVDEKYTADGQKIQELKQQKITVMRPGKVRIDRKGPNGKAALASNGEQLVLINYDKNVYAKAEAPATLPELVTALRERLQVDAPGGDFLFPQPYEVLIEGLQMGHYIGLEPIGEVMAHHIAVTEKDIDWQIWIQDGAQPVPLRYVITSKDMPSHPQYTLELRNWEPSPKLSKDLFTLTPPAGAKPIERGEMAPTRTAPTR